MELSFHWDDSSKNLNTQRDNFQEESKEWLNSHHYLPPINSNQKILWVESFETGELSDKSYEEEDFHHTPTRQSNKNQLEFSWDFDMLENENIDDEEIWDIVTEL